MNAPAFTQDIKKFNRLPAFTPVTVKNWRNGVAVRMPNHLGDAVMALPALMQLKKILPPHCGIFVITPAGNRELYDALEFVSGVLLLSGAHRSWSWQEIRELRKLRCGCAIAFNNSPRDVIAMRLAGVPSIYGNAARGRSLLLTKAFRFPKRIPGDATQSHQTMRYLAMTAALGAPAWQGELPQFTPPPLDELNFECSFLLRCPNLLLLAPGAAYGAAKRWSRENFNAVAKYWIGRGGTVAALGSPGEKEIADGALTDCPPDKAFNLCGKTGLFTLMHLFKAACCTVANDSGLMHLGAVLDTCGIVPFGPTDFTDTGPITGKWRLISDCVECAPCLKHSCPRSEKICMQNLTADRVIAELAEIAADQKIPLS